MRSVIMSNRKTKSPSSTPSSSSSNSKQATPKKSSGLFRGRLSSLSNKQTSSTSASTTSMTPGKPASTTTPKFKTVSPPSSSSTSSSTTTTPSMTAITPSRTIMTTPNSTSMSATTTPTTNARSPPKNAVSNNDKEATHIEVCVRIRPLEILLEREGFFDSKKATPSRTGRLQPRTPQQSSSPTATTTGTTNASSDVVAWNVSDDGDTASQSPLTDLIQGRTHSYTLDKVYGPQSNTKDLYDHSVNPLVKSAMEGYHSSILAYGQTSTGKTFTMTGTRTSPGLIPRCIGDCFRYLKSCPESREYLFRLSYLEVYNEHIRDLLSETPQPIRLFEHQTEGLVIRGLKEEIVTSPDHVFSILRQGEKRRQVGATHMNLHSSRSHTLVRLWIESTESSTTNSSSGGGSSRRNSSSNNNNNKTSAARISSLSLVDLAGSESVRLNGGDRRDEGTYINKSLMTLGKVVSALSEPHNKNKAHIPYRDSKLTRLLQPSLSGNARMVLICCISPSTSHLEESHNTFKFATRAKRIEQKAVINHAGANELTMLQTYRDEIDDLRRQLAEAKEEQEKLKEQKVKDISSSPAAGPAAAAEEVEELVEAIQSMERLILKSRQGGGGGAVATPVPARGPTPDETTKPMTSKGSTNETHNKKEGDHDGDGNDDSDVDLLAELLDDELHVTDDEEDFDLRGDGDVLPTSSSGEFSPSPATPPTDKNNNTNDDEDDIDGELRRIRGLLGSVLQRHRISPPKAVIGATSPDTTSSTGSTTVSPEKSTYGSVTSRLFGVSPRSSKKAAALEAHEVQHLKQQLIQQEATTNLSKADATFLQNQLREKDELLEEIAKVLEAVEKRQTELEKENATLRKDLQLALAAVKSSSSSQQSQ